MISKDRLLEILDKSKPEDTVSWYTEVLLSTLILMNLVAVSLESVPSLGTQYSKIFLYFEVFSVIIFSVEYSARIWASAAKKDTAYSSNLGKRLTYVFSFTGIIDFLAIVPSILALFIVSVDLRWLRVLRLLRLLKISHYSSALEDLWSAIRHERSSFVAALYLFAIALFFSSAMMYVVEHTSQPDKFSSIPETMWWSLITLTTVGYGDVSPLTPAGKVIGAITAIMGVCVVALLTGIVANAFANQVARRKAILEAEVANALLDGEISEEEGQKIETLRKRFDLSQDHVSAIIEVFKDTKNSK
jgi:voltage-gated potassium channel